MSPDKFEELKTLALPLYDWLCKNYCPHTSIIIEYDGIRVVDDNMFLPLAPKEEFM
jgi:hypothetical protein